MAGGDYGRIRHTFWTDPDIKRGLSIEQKALLLYYFTSPHSSLAGLYYCPFGYVALETGIGAEEVREWTMGVLSKYVSYDEVTEEIFVHRAGRHQVGDDLKLNDKRIKAIQKAVSETHSRWLVSAFLETYKHWPLGIDPPEPEAPSKPLRSPFNGVAPRQEAPSKPKQLTGQGIKQGKPVGEPPTGGQTGIRVDPSNLPGVYGLEHGYGPGDLLIAMGEDVTAWRTPTGEIVAPDDRLRCLKLADAHLAEPGCKAHNRRSALKFVIAQQYDPFAIRAAASQPASMSPVSAALPGIALADEAAADARLKKENPIVYAETVREFEALPWWPEAGAGYRRDQIRQRVKERLTALYVA